MQIMPSWYMDAMENYKEVTTARLSNFLPLYTILISLERGVMVPGRFAMTCCIEDVTFIGFKCKV